MKVLISGGGIAGNALAFWLSRTGHDVTVIERHPEMRATGLQIDLRGHGVEVMKRMGLEQVFRTKQVPEQGLQIVDTRDRRWAYFPVNKTGKGLQSFTTDAEIMRGDLCHIMYDAIKEQVKYIFGVSMESLEETDNSVKVQFTDGTMGHFDLVVGADGMWSHTRKMMFGPDTKETFRPLGGVYAAYFTIPQPIQDGEEYLATVYTAPERRTVMTRRHTPESIQVYLSCKSELDQLVSARRGDVDGEKQAFREVYQGAGWQMTDILQAMMESKDFYCERMGLVTLNSWSKGRVTLVGDAAYCPTAMTGMGTTCGMVGAYVLAGEIGRHCKRANDDDDDSEHDRVENLATALKAYESKFRPFMDQVQKGISENVYSKMPSSPLGIAIMNWFLWLVALLKLNLLGRWVLREDVKGWDLPEYEELLQV